MNPSPNAGRVSNLTPRRQGMREVAERAGVAISSVSRVLSDHADVSPRMRDKVLAAVDELGYEPDMLAQSMRRRQTLTVGFVVGDISNPLFAEIVSGAETAMRREGYSVLLMNSEGESKLELDHIRLLGQRRVDGFILSTAAEDYEPTYELLERLTTPVVMIDRDFPARRGISRVLSDHEGGMRIAVEHLIDLGHRRIGAVLGGPLRPSRERRRALEGVLEARGLPKDACRIVEGSLSSDHGAAAAELLLTETPLPSAIIAGSNQILSGVLGVLAERGVEVGRDISLVSCDEIPLTRLYKPPIAVVRRNTHEIGRCAAEFLLRRLRGEAPPGDVVLPTEFVPRPSCVPTT